jgi:hypothetical protein
MKNPVNKDGFIQICIVVADIEKAAKGWADLLGVPVPEVRSNNANADPNITYRGEVATYGLKVANIKMGNFVIELHEPDKQDSTFSEFYAKHGNGVHHIGFEVGERRDAIVAELGEEGYDMRQIGFYPGSSWTIVDSEDVLGVNLNIKPKA